MFNCGLERFYYSRQFECLDIKSNVPELIVFNVGASAVLDTDSLRFNMIDKSSVVTLL